VTRSSDHSASDVDNNLMRVVYLLVVFCKNNFHLRGPVSSVGIASDYGLDGPGSNPGRDEIFPPSRGAELTPPPPSSAEGPRKSRAIPLLTLRAFVACEKGENLRTSVYRDVIVCR